MPGTESGRGVAVAAAIMGLWVVDISNNALAGPCRALVSHPRLVYKSKENGKKV
jgi:hypothetical protein